MSQAPLVSVIVPVFNPGEYFAPFLKSIAAQDHPRFEVILVDDGSSDGSERLADQAAAGDARFRVIHQPNRGAAAARAEGLRHAGGDFVILMDSDDLVHPQLLSTLAGGCLAANASLAFCRFAPFSGEAPADMPPCEGSVLEAPRHLEMLLHDQRLDYALSNKMFRAGAITPEMLLCPYRYNEDLLAAWRAFTGLDRAVFFDFDGYHCRQHAGSISHRGISPVFLTDQWEVAKLILADAAGTSMEASAHAFYDEKLLYLYSMILRQRETAAFASLEEALRAELRPRLPGALRNPALSLTMKAVAIATCWFTPLWRPVCRLVLRDRR